MEHNPPVPTLQPGKDPLHTFLGFTPGRQILSMSPRDSYDGREMPPNGNSHVSVYSLRGVRKLSPMDWRSYVLTCQPDVVFALSDTPFTDPPYSQKRLTKSIERSANWLAPLLRPISDTTPPTSAEGTPKPNHPLNILVHMSGGSSIPARRAFSDSLLEPLFGPEAEAVAPLKTLDDGVRGYTFDLIPLRQSLEATERKATSEQASSLPSTTATPTTADLNPILPSHIDSIVPLLKASLAKPPTDKIRLLNSVEGPHEVLGYITEVGVDLFDAHWAQRAADVGVALDFEFPIRSFGAEAERKEIGHNLYEERFAFDFGPLADSFRGAGSIPASDTSTGTRPKPICPCAACSPLSPSSRIYHGFDTPDVSLESETVDLSKRSHYTRAYIHHLLHTHEMSAHSFLVMHNLEVLELFFDGVRGVIAACTAVAEASVSSPPLTLLDSEASMPLWKEEVRRFFSVYEKPTAVLQRAKESWREVELARGKGRLAREKDKQEEVKLGRGVDVGLEAEDGL